LDWKTLTDYGIRRVEEQVTTLRRRTVSQAAAGHKHFLADFWLAGSPPAAEARRPQEDTIGIV